MPERHQLTCVCGRRTVEERVADLQRKKTAMITAAMQQQLTKQVRASLSPPSHLSDKTNRQTDRQTDRKTGMGLYGFVGVEVGVGDVRAEGSGKGLRAALLGACEVRALSSLVICASVVLEHPC